MRAVADRLGSFLGSLTTVPEPAPTLPAPAKPKSQTTFGEAAAEIVDQSGDGFTDGDPVIPRRRPLTFALVAAVIVGLGIGGILARRGQAPSAPRTKVPAIWTGVPAPGVIAAAAGTSPAPPVAAAVKEREPRARPAGKTAPAAKHAAAHRTLATASPAEPAAAVTPPSGTKPPAPSDGSGAWEGAWTDAEHHQHGRLYLQVGADGNAVGWFSNANAAQSYRLTGRAESPGVFLLSCDCPPNQAFTVRAVLNDRDGELRGRLTLFAAAGVFGESHVALRRASAR